MKAFCFVNLNNIFYLYTIWFIFYLYTIYSPHYVRLSFWYLAVNESSFKRGTLIRNILLSRLFVLLVWFLLTLAQASCIFLKVRKEIQQWNVKCIWGVVDKNFCTDICWYRWSLRWTQFHSFVGLCVALFFLNYV